MAILPNFTGIAHHDALPAYNVFDQARHALCYVHVLRELNGVIDRESSVAKSRWAAELKTLLKEIKSAVDASTAGKLTTERADQYEKQYVDIIQAGLERHPARRRSKSRKRGRVKQTKTHNLLVRLRDRRQDYLRFMRCSEAAFDNNQAERDLRMLKVKQKVSGCFRSKVAGQKFMRIRSFVSTAIKQGADPIEKLLAVFAGDSKTVMALG